MSVICYYHPCYSTLDLPATHRFPIKKYRLLFEAIKTLDDSNHFQFQLPTPATSQQLLLCHSSEYVMQFLTGELDSKAIRKMGFPWSKELVERTCLSVGASINAAQIALKYGFSLQLSGGYHHAFTDFGSGFCIFNDLAIAAAHCIELGLVERVLIFDCDVHQGDGTAQISQQQSNIISCSIHCEQNFPAKKQQSDLDFALNKGCTDDEYLSTVQQALTLATRLYQPDLILYNAGADIFAQDELGYLNISLEGVYQRDLAVIGFCQAQSIPLACAIGGGYMRDINQLVNVHLQLFKAALQYHK
ncbi:histone deacetylase [Pseudoalteromonas tunicata]|jgi:acetoin utilization deacetylase AcuC-like enzyme|uniref:Histone deacetylase family protein n=1 Tax=Pseudoalteromonas tunicata D2 TaxID=87626 RepID=A4C5S3_9GAMM|nr:hypothetical protein PTUN_a2896 [Pseudoalteromonas tunicata]AXT30902.1 histone deacetylase [Pseudoalteromonas tunicata]EAR29327.1 histone deacetylase family protein [Pseudoalteromonas tunicata D2]